MTVDAIVAEVRRGRGEHAAKFNYDLAMIFADHRQSEQMRSTADFPLVEPPEAKSVPGGSSLQRARFARG